MNDINPYKFLRIKNGRPYFALINIDIKKSEIQNKIIENYSGNGYSNHSIDVGRSGAESWKKGLIIGLEFILSKNVDFWEININGLEGKPITDTNPTIVGYTGILAFCEKTNFKLDKNLLDQIENFVYTSWDNGNAEKVPNFHKLSFEKS